jgi:hypothetical protein
VSIYYIPEQEAGEILYDADRLSPYSENVLKVQANKFLWNALKPSSYVSSLFENAENIHSI